MWDRMEVMRNLERFLERRMNLERKINLFGQGNLYQTAVIKYICPGICV